MTAMTSRLEAIQQSLQHLLPPGAAWPRDDASVWMRLLRGVSALLAELDDVTALAALEWLPHATRTRLEEWERAAGLPDPCFGALQSVDARRAALLARLRGHQGAYTDSSPAAPGAIAAYCAAVGTPATVVYNVPFRVGRNRVGQRLGALDGRLYITTSAGTTPLRVGVGRVGQRLVEHSPGVTQLTCALDSVVPARFAIVVG